MASCNGRERIRVFDVMNFCFSTGVKLEGHVVPGTVLCFFPGTVVRARHNT